jgi:hypothetical protein
MPKKAKSSFEKFRDLAQRVVNAPKSPPQPKKPREA